MANIDILLEKEIARVVKSNTKNQMLFSALGQRYAYSQLSLDKIPDNHAFSVLLYVMAPGPTSSSRDSTA